MPDSTKSNHSTIILPIKLSKDHLNKMIQDQFQPIKLNDQLKITDLFVDGEDDKVKLTLDVIGSYNGKIMVDFMPLFDNELKKITISNLEIQLENDGLLRKGMNWVLQSFLQEKIQSMVQNQVDEQLKTMISSYLNEKQNIPLPSELKSEIEVLDAQMFDLHFEKDILSLKVELEAKIKVLSHSL